MPAEVDYARPAKGSDVRPKIRPFRLLLSWLVAAAALFIAAWIVPGVDVQTFWGALLVALVIAILNAILPPLVAALRLPFTLVLGFLLVLILDAWMLLGAARITEDAIEVDRLSWALLTALIASAVTVVLDVIFGTNDDDTYTIRVIQRIARRSGERVQTDVPGIIYLEIDGLALPVVQRAMRDGNAPNMARWLAEDSHRFIEWETDLSSQTGASQAGILLGSNEDIPAFRWVEKETGTMMTCSAPADCAELERRHGTGIGLLVDGGASRGNLLSGEADHVILTVSRMDAEKGANPGYRAFFSNGFNVTRVLVLFLSRPRVERSAAGDSPGRPPTRPSRRDLPVHARRAVRRRPRPDRIRRPHGHDEGPPRDVRDVLELRRSGAPLGARARGHARGAAQARPAVRPHRPGAEVRPPPVRDRRPLRPRPDAASDLQAAQRVRPGRARRALADSRGGGGLVRWRRAELDGRSRVQRSDWQRREEKEAAQERRLRPERRRHGLGQPPPHLPHGGEPAPDARGDPGTTPATHPGTARASPCRLAPRALVGARACRAGRWRDALPHRRPHRGRRPARALPPNAAGHLRRTDGFAHVADIMVGSFYDPELDEGCAFEELISFHGGMGGPQTRAFTLFPADLPLPDEPIVGAAAVHGLLRSWRQHLQATS